MGVCFGNYTEKCDLTMTTESLQIPIVFDVASEELAISQYIFINNTSEKIVSFFVIHRSILWQTSLLPSNSQFGSSNSVLYSILSECYQSFDTHPS